MSKKNRVLRQETSLYWKSLMRLSIVLVPVFIALAIFLSLLFWNGPMPSHILSLIIFVSGFSGIIIIVKREIPLGFYSITGLQAVGEGTVFVLVCWIGALYLYLQGL